MQRMNVRTSYALDRSTTDNIKQLARLWGVSQAEVIRRSISRVASEEATAMTPADVVAHYACGGLPERSKAELQKMTRSLRQARHAEEMHRSIDL